MGSRDATPHDRKRYPPINELLLGHLLQLLSHREEHAALVDIQYTLVLFKRVLREWTRLPSDTSSIHGIVDTTKLVDSSRDHGDYVLLLGHVAGYSENLDVLANSCRYLLGDFFQRFGLYVRKYKLPDTGACERLYSRCANLPSANSQSSHSRQRLRQ